MTVFSVTGNHHRAFLFTLAECKGERRRWRRRWISTGEFAGAAGGMLGHTLQDIDQVVVRIDLVEPAVTIRL